jgi:hypothetical protein
MITQKHKYRIKLHSRVKVINTNDEEVELEIQKATGMLVRTRAPWIHAFCIYFAFVRSGVRIPGLPWPIVYFFLGFLTP